jgi:amino acid transporter
MPSKKKSSLASRIKAIIIVAVGVILFVLGIGMWVSPEVDWNGFMGAWSLLGDEFARLKDDPFAVLGVLVIIAAVIIAYHGIKRLVKG